MSSGRPNEKRHRMGRSDAPATDDPSSKDASDDRGSMTLVSDEMPGLADLGLNQETISEAFVRFQDDLNQKDELIAALIKELEQAAEQLDRIQRSGADRSAVEDNVSMSSPSLDLGQSRTRAADDLRLMAEEWGQSQPPVVLARIESELAALHDLVLSMKRDGVHAEPAAPISFEERLRQYELQQDNESQQEPDRGNMTLAESSPKWDEIKAQLQFPEATPSTVEASEPDPEILRIIANLPTPREVSLDSASLDELKAAVLERDDFIIQLNRLFRTRNTLSLPKDWAHLANVPGEMQIRVESLIEHLDVQVRLGEVEMSLERARLARERATVQAEREAIEKHMKRLGLTSIAELDNISAATGTASDRRWMRFLGPNTR